ncbi:MAG: Hpt domain-containing protein, partial [Planctomycetota bacterium]|nr:Hpt domain-containing protein [Planctomycetota bacterium]
MLNDSTLEKLRHLASDLILIDASSAGDEWRRLATAATGLAEEFLQAGEADARELARLLAEVAESLAKGMIANPAEGVKAVQSIVGVLQGLEAPAGMPDSLRKQALAEGRLFFRDARKEESRVEEDSAFEDDGERREMIRAIEARIDELDSDLLNLSPPVVDSEQVRSIFRQFHTLKGEGAICGIKSVAEFCHGIETEIEDARQGGLALTAEIIAALQELSGILRPILAGRSREEIGEELIRSLMGELREAVAQARKRRENGELSAPPPAGEEGGADRFADFFSGFAPPPAAAGDGDGPAPAEAGRESPGATAGLRREEAAALLEELTPEDFLSALGEAAKPAEGRVDPLPGEGGEVRPGAPKPAERPAGARTGSGKKSSGDTVIESGELLGLGGDTAAMKKEMVEKRIKSISVDVARLDELLETVSEVSLLGAFLTSRLAGHSELALSAANLFRSCGRLHEAANSLRMTSIRPLFMTVRRTAAEAARSSRKMIDINMLGIDTQVDRSIVESLSAALIHLVRNAVDHGIEPADVRLRLGKPERGSIVISAARTSSDIVIELGDDGRGFNLEAIRDKAVSMGKISPEAGLSEGELADLVFLPGLSTARKVTGLSGRGVGMEIVRESIDNLRGKVEIRTAENKGTTIRLRFPLMVAAMDAMLVRVGGSILALPVSQVRECFQPRPGDLGSVEGRGAIVTIRGVILPILFLGREFG